MRNNQPALLTLMNQQHSLLTRIRQTRGVKTTVELFVLLVIFFTVQSWMQRDMVKGMAPPIHARLLDGTNFSLQAAQGEPVLVHFWAVWCGICKLEQGTIHALSKTHRVITIASQSGSTAEVSQFMQQQQLDFPVINDPDGDIARLYGVRGFPTSFILHPDGRIAYSQTGYTTGWGLRIRLWLANN
ncbi:MAG: protein disulfide oxidoreductase [Gammaproteobacteria bacterium]|nr:protein disulfide oxidoreductase [Gammaproteobacteria bacterium]